MLPCTTLAQHMVSSLHSCGHFLFVLTLQCLTVPKVQTGSPGVTAHWRNHNKHVGDADLLLPFVLRDVETRKTYFCTLRLCDARTATFFSRTTAFSHLLSFAFGFGNSSVWFNLLNYFLLEALIFSLLAACFLHCLLSCCSLAQPRLVQPASGTSAVEMQERRLAI